MSLIPSATSHPLFFPSLTFFFSRSPSPPSLARVPLFPHPTTPHTRSRPRPPPSPSSPSRSFCTLSSFGRRALCTPSVRSLSHIHRTAATTTATLTARPSLSHPSNPSGQLSFRPLMPRRCPTTHEGRGGGACGNVFHTFVTYKSLTRPTLTHCEVCPPPVDDSSLSTTETIAQSIAACRRCAGTLFQRF